jgi:hypothetical protein
MSTDKQNPPAEDLVEEITRTDWDGYDYPGTAVVERVADVLDRDMTELPLLQSTVDVDALETLLSAETAGTVQISFQYAGLWVTIRSDRSMQLGVPWNRTT